MFNRRNIRYRYVNGYRFTLIEDLDQQHIEVSVGDDLLAFFPFSATNKQVEDFLLSYKPREEELYEEEL